MATKRRHKWEQIISCLLSSRTLKEASAKLNMNYSSLVRLVRSDEEFKERYLAERKSLLNDVKTSLLQSAVTGAKVLQDGLDDEMESYVSRFPLAKFAIESAINIEISDAVLAKIEQPSKDEWDCVPSSKNDEEDAE
jgi:hypothetical protein